VAVVERAGEEIVHGCDATGMDVIADVLLPAEASS
jgi:hypothetical protein